ncbi:MAG: metal-dependent hydrolase [Candidatus Korobacteraceae bacterium]
MEPVTHFLTGACMGRAGYNRKSALATLTMVLAAEAADIDVVWGFKGSIAALQHHRGITHSFVGVPFIAAAVLLFVYLGHRVRLRFRPPRARPAGAPPKLPIRWGSLYIFAVIAALSHLLLDYTTAYGIRLFEPFNFRWYSWDIVYIIDPFSLLALLAGLTRPSLFGLINQEIGARSKGPRGRAGAIFALVCLVLIWGFRDYQHRRAIAAMNSFLYHGAAPLRLAAYPYMVDPFSWHGVVETPDFFETVPVNSLGPEVDDSQGLLFYKPPETAASRAAKASYLGQVYLDWAVFPFVEVQQFQGATSGYLAEFKDLRYTYPEIQGSRTVLGGYVVLSPDLRVLEEGMNSSRSPTVDSLESGDTGP